jgi:hypothetical protein
MMPLKTARGKSREIIQIPSSMPSSTKAVLNPSKAKPPLLAQANSVQKPQMIKSKLNIQQRMQQEVSFNAGSYNTRR